MRAERADSDALADRADSAARAERADSAVRAERADSDALADRADSAARADLIDSALRADRAETDFPLIAGLLPTLDTRSSLMSFPVAFLILDLCSSVSLIRTSFAMWPSFCLSERISQSWGHAAASFG